MLKEAIERIRDYFYQYPNNPVELNETEENVKSLIPEKRKVVGKGADSITTEDLKKKAEDKYGIRQDTARKKAYLLKKLGVADKFGKKTWVRTGRYKKLSEKKLRNLFAIISIFFLGLSFKVGNPWPLYFATILLVITVLLFG